MFHCRLELPVGPGASGILSKYVPGSGKQKHGSFFYYYYTKKKFIRDVAKTSGVVKSFVWCVFKKNVGRILSQVKKNPLTPVLHMKNT